MLDRSSVFAAAWKAYRIARPAFWAAGDETGKRRYLPALFARLLRTAWAHARKADATARRFMELQQRGQVAIARQMEPGERSARISAIRDRLEVLDYAPFGVRAVEKRAALKGELAALTAA